MIRFAKEKDIDAIMAFIDTYWRKGHILGNDKEFFQYEHLLEEGVSYVISEDENGEINAILGYIPYGKTNRDLMTVMWKANHTAHASLGLELFKFLKENGDARIMASPGSNPKLKGLYHYLGYQFGKMTHWYRLRYQSNYYVAKILDDEIPSVDGNAEYIEIATWKDLESQFDFENYTKAVKPYKEAWYIKKRYFNHPKYNYRLFGIKNTYGKVDLLLIFRVISVNDYNVVRLVDCIGDFSIIDSISNVLDDVLEKYKAEYVDCYEAGLPDKFMICSGWKKTEGSGNIIPNYFAPFMQENIDIYYFTSDPEIVLFKGDGDQDRPN